MLCEMFASSGVQIAPRLQIRPRDPAASWEEEAHDANEVSASILKLEWVAHGCVLAACAQEAGSQSVFGW